MRSGRIDAVLFRVLEDHDLLFGLGRDFKFAARDLVDRADVVLDEIAGKVIDGPKSPVGVALGLVVHGDDDARLQRDALAHRLVGLPDEDAAGGDQSRVEILQRLFLVGHQRAALIAEVRHADAVCFDQEDRVGAAESAAREVVRALELCDRERGGAARAQAHTLAAVVVAVLVRHEDLVGFEVKIRERRADAAGLEGVDDDVVVLLDQLKAGMTVSDDLHRDFSFIRKHIWSHSIGSSTFCQLNFVDQNP